MASKYDTYWQGKLEAILALFDDARLSRKSGPLALSDLVAQGDRERWRGTLELVGGQRINTANAPLRSLSELLGERLPKWARELAWRVMLSQEGQLAVEQVDLQKLNWFEDAYRRAKLAETIRLAEAHLGPIKPTGVEPLYVEAKTGAEMYVIFCTKADGWFAPRVSRLDQVAQRNGYLLFSLTDEVAATICLWRIPATEMTRRIQEKGYKPTLDLGKAYSFGLVSTPEADIIKPLDWDVRPYRLDCEPTELTRATFTPQPGEAPGKQPAGGPPKKPAVDVVQRLQQWKQEATDPQHPNYPHADLDQPARVYATISALVDKLHAAPESFGREDVVALFGALNSGQRMKNKVADGNPLPQLREHLLTMLDGEGAPSARIAAANQTVQFAGLRMLGELYGWAHADTAPLYNDCAADALAYLGYQFDPDNYDAFVAAHEQFKQVYQQRVGHLKPDLPLNLEIDKLYNVIDKVDLKQQPGNGKLAKPFDEMFASMDEAQWAFQLLAETAHRLGLVGPDDEKAAFNLRRRADGYHLRLSYGVWLALGITGIGGSLKSISLALLNDQIPLEPTTREEFTLRPDDRPVSLCSYPIEKVRPFPDDLQAAFHATLGYARERFAKRRRSLHRSANKPDIARAVFDQQARDHLLRQGTEATRQRFWKIAPGPNASIWEQCRDGGYIAVGWKEMGDMSGLDRAAFLARCEEVLARNPTATQQDLEQFWRFLQIQEDDRIIANRGTVEILGIGTVTGAYYFEPGVPYGQRLPVRWDDVKPRPVNKGGWRKTLIELSQGEFEQLIRINPQPEPPGGSESPFTEEAFRLLAQLHSNPTHAFYTANKEALRAHIIEPFKKLMMAVRNRLPTAILETMETEKYIFAGILKQFAEQGCWDFYWGAFYPKGGKRIEDAQLSLWMNFEILEYGFYIGAYGSEQRKRFERNCQKHGQVLLPYFREALPETVVTFGSHDNFTVTTDGKVQAKVQYAWEQFLRNPSAANNDVSVIVPRQQLLATSEQALVAQIVETYEKLFPLVLLATEDDPLPAIGDYLEWAEPQPLNPEYPLAQCAQDTGFEEADLARWVRAIERKGQAIIYGPPGTGKTYIAEHLARHLIGGGEGFYDLVQFHPAYAYEDFIQGIRPRREEDGQLDYPTVPGRFLEFCRRARACEGRCVLIIDEVNRANLARVFGELMYLLEYRDREMPLAGGGTLRIPGNVRLIGTMNTADRSIALVDHALRRRFAFLALRPDYGILQRYHQQTGFNVEPLIRKLKDLNKQIGDPNYEVGITFFLREDLAHQIPDIWTMEIEPYLEEYFFDPQDRAKIEAFRWEKLGEEILG